ncbi:MAG: tRNA lysidine(34) synthetase TilS [Candidatus Omnitrophota bacterium]
MVEELFDKTIRDHHMLARKDRVILGVSGGPDSVCMLKQFVRIKGEYKCALVCAHFNHSLRPQADAEEAFVKELCKELGVTFTSEKKDVQKLYRGDSLEQSARNLRFDFFVRVAHEHKAKKLALAHHKDDVVETTLMRIIRGTALRGLRGILPVTKIRGLAVIRPLLAIRKDEILQWLEIHKVPYMLDDSNLEDKFFRNKIRLNLLPQLTQFNPNISGALFNLARLAALDYECIRRFTKEKYERLKKQKGRHYIKLSLAQLASEPEAMLLNIMRFAIEELKGDTRKLELRHLEEIMDLIRHRPNYSIVDLPDLEVKKEEHWLVIKSLLF